MKTYFEEGAIMFKGDTARDRVYLKQFMKSQDLDVTYTQTEDGKVFVMRIAIDGSEERSIGGSVSESGTG